MLLRALPCRNRLNHRHHVRCISTVYDELLDRGLVHSTTSSHVQSVVKAPTCVYVGFDPSAPSLHLGNYVALLALAHFQRRGHHAIALIGGATGAIGDPSGRSTERNLLDRAKLLSNVDKITTQIKNVMSRLVGPAERSGQLSVLNNYDWTHRLSIVDFLREIGTFYRVNTMLSKESVQRRLEANRDGLTLSEFFYQALQGMDSYYLFKKYGCQIQLGGSDQLGNITAGIDLILAKQAQLENLASPYVPIDDLVPEESWPVEERSFWNNVIEQNNCHGTRVGAYGLALPLLTNSKGQKFGKSVGGAVFLDPVYTSAFDMHQFLLKLPYQDVARYIYQLTLMDKESVEQVLKKHDSLQSRGESQTYAIEVFADYLVELLHGVHGLKQAKECGRLFFSKDRTPADAGLLGPGEGVCAYYLDISPEQLRSMSCSDAFYSLGCFASKSEMNRAFKAGSCKVQRKVCAPSDPLPQDPFILISVGKTTFRILRTRTDADLHASIAARPQYER